MTTSLKAFDRSVLIVTIQDNVNYGTYLQIVALNKILEDRHFKVELLNYIRPDHTSSGRFLTLLGADKRRNALYRIARATIATIANWVSFRFLRSFLDTHVKTTREYKTYLEVEKDPPQASAYIAGSDQIWNSTYNRGIDRTYFLDFAPTGKKRIAYAASFGKTALSEDEYVTTKELLDRFDFISLRESAGVDLVKRLGFKDAKLVLDPTLLLNSEEWKKLVPTRKLFERYLLIYSVENYIHAELISAAQKIAKKLNLKIYSVSPAAGNREHLKHVDKTFFFARMKTFFSLISQAEFVVAASFHGTALAINLNRQFVSFSPKNFSSRIESLLSLTGLRSRTISSADFRDADVFSPIDYARVNDILDKEREYSLLYLETALRKTLDQPATDSGGRRRLQRLRQSTERQL